MGGNGGDGSDFFFAVDADGHAADFVGQSGRARFDTTLEEHGVGASGDILQPFMDDVLRQDGGGGGAVTSDVVGFGGRFFQKLGAHVFKGVFQFNFFGDGDAVMGDGGCAEFLVQSDVAAFGAEGSGNGRCHRINPFL